MTADVRYDRLPDWAGRAHRLCAQCGRLFSGQTAFDRHQSEHYDRPTPPYIDCHDPTTRGHRWNENRRAWSHGVPPDPSVFAVGADESAEFDADTDAAS